MGKYRKVEQKQEISPKNTIIQIFNFFFLGFI